MFSGYEGASAEGFSGRFHFAWESSPNYTHRNMRLLRSVSFKSKTGKIWRVPRGAVINGASIPRVFWTPVGSPYVGRYRRASVIHDYYCAIGTEPQRDVHRIFWEAMLFDKLNPSKARVMYLAVKVANSCPQAIKLTQQSELEAYLEENPDAFPEQLVEVFRSAVDDDKTFDEGINKRKEIVLNYLSEDEKSIFDAMLRFRSIRSPANLDLVEEMLNKHQISDQRFNEIVILVQSIYK